MRRKIVEKPKSRGRSLDSNKRAKSIIEFARNPAINELRDVAITRHYPRGSMVFNEGQRPDGVYVLREGRTKVSITSAEGKTLVLRIARPGDLLGINATLTDQPYCATVETLEPCRIDFISRKSLLKQLARDMHSYIDLAQVLSRNLSGMVDHVRLLFLSQSVSERLARLLLRWCDEQGTRTSRGIRIEAGLTHEEMAQMICASRETVTRTLGQLRRKHIVSLVGNAIFVRNRNALEAMAQI